MLSTLGPSGSQFRFAVEDPVPSSQTLRPTQAFGELKGFYWTLDPLH